MHELERINPAEWARIDDAMLWLWVLVGCVILLAGSILFGRAVLPSLIETRSVPERAARIIPLFYVTGAAAIIGIVIVASMFGSEVEVLYDIFPEVWY